MNNHQLPPKFHTLKDRLQEITALQGASAVLTWDQSTKMPLGGAQARGEQIAALGRIAHQKFVDPVIGHLLDDLQAYEERLDFDSDEASLIRVTRRNYQQATKIPSDFMADVYRHQAILYSLWVQARPKNDFKSLIPRLEKNLDFSRQYADYFKNYDHIADPLIDIYDYGFKAQDVKKIFEELRKELVPMVQVITAQEPPDDSCLHQQFLEEAQLQFGVEIIKRFGYDFDRGRQDQSPHPFAIRFAAGDVRITTRIRENFLSEALFGTLHESGHAMYEQGIKESLEGTTLASGTSAAVHESQSRLWENLVGRSRAFWEYYYPKLQMTFHEQLRETALDDFYRAINKVACSLIRTDADEVTYNLHVMIRFDLELALLEGRLAIKDLPEAWYARYEQDLGRKVPNDTDGVLQDIHWYHDLIGGSFQGYTLGNILSAQFYEAVLKAHPDIPQKIASGEFQTLHTWLKNNIYQHGSKFTSTELLERATGQPLTIRPYVQYLKKKFGELYIL